MLTIELLMLLAGIALLRGYQFPDHRQLTREKYAEVVKQLE